MKIIVNDKVHDTVNSEKVYSYKYGNSDQADYTHEILYAESNGGFFLFYEGGTLSPYGCYQNERERDGFNWGIRPLSYNEAEAKARRYCSVDEYETFFGRIRTVG